MKTFHKKNSMLFVLLVIVFSSSLFSSYAEDMSTHPVNPFGTEAVIPGSGIAVIADTSEIYAEVTGVSMNEDNGAYEAEIYFCNRSGHPLDVRSDYAAVNGYVMDSYMFDVIAPHQRNFIYLNVFNEDLEQACVQSVDMLTFKFVVKDETMNDIAVNSESVNGETADPSEIFSDVVTLYPSGLRPEDVQVKALKDFPAENYPFAQLTFTNDFIDFRVIDARPTENGYFYQITAVAENLCDRDILLSGTHFVVDGAETEPYWYCRIPAGMKAVTDIWIDAESMAAVGVTEFDSISFSLALYKNMDFYEAENSTPFFAYPLSFRPAKG